MATCRGIDVSVYQGPQNWAAHKAEGIVFAFAKASEGMHSRDAHFAQHITAIKAAGLVPGAYHFSWPNQDVKAEAANYIAAVKAYAGKGFVHWLDLERRGDGANYKGVSAAQIHAWAAAWVAAVEKAFPGQRVGIYTAGSDLAAGHAPTGVTLWYPAYPWGAAPYSKAEAAAHPHPSGTTPLFWQFTSQPADRSICYLSADGLRTWAGSAPAPAAKPHVSLAHVVAAAKHDPAAAQGHTTHKAEVLIVEHALKAEGLLEAKYVDGSFGTKTRDAYKAWQKSKAGGSYAGSAADGIPGHDSLTRLGKRRGFTVAA